MTSIITGDIINSRKLDDSGLWMKPLKTLLHTLGKSPKTWEISRGDSFQLEVPQPENALLTAILIKATIRSVKGQDVRLAIGIGQRKHTAASISESNGQVFIFSGEKLDEIKKEKQTLAIKTPWDQFDRELNLCLRLGLIAMNSWSTKAAEIMKISLEHPRMENLTISKRLGISQSSASERRKRAHYAEIMDLDLLYREKLKALIPHDIID